MALKHNRFPASHFIPQFPEIVSIQCCPGYTSPSSPPALPLIVSFVILIFLALLRSPPLSARSDDILERFFDFSYNEFLLASPTTFRRFGNAILKGRNKRRRWKIRRDFFDMDISCNGYLVIGEFIKFIYKR